MDMEFITGEPAIKLGNTLVIADLHLGAEHDFRKAGISMPSQTAKEEARLMMLIRQTRARRLLILGDVKHRVPGTSWQEEREVPQFLSKLSHHVSVEVTPGNHDGGLEKLCPGIIIHPSEGVRVGKCYLSHGHAWPNEEFLKCKSVIMGHNHPQVEFSDKIGKVWREKVWIRAELKRKPLEAHYKTSLRGSVLPGLVVMPAFGGLVGGWAMNDPRDAKRQHKNSPEGFGPIMKCADAKHALAYMLDGTFLGEMSRI
jgi:putative SbcD/Mre11-related phosphoesterase